MIGECCDVCSMKESTQLVDCYSEIKAIVQTVKHFPDKGEKQVGFLHVVSLHFLNSHACSIYSNLFLRLLNV